ncbi:ATP synthase F0 subcomplex subunit OSCP atp5 [Globomyces sp. JEL0801]|nr:ATP synthase F0 subcomplex subunit OSCP atp5 [Globomyces sp. JEL0801]
MREGEFTVIPVKLHGIEGRYATALFAAASRQQVLPKVEEELKSIKQLLDQDAGVKNFLETPTVDRQKKMKGLDIILGKNKNPITLNFFNVLAENGRLDQTVKIIDAYNTLMTAFRAEVSVTVTSAQPLDSRTLAKVKDVLAKNKLAGANGKMIIANKVDTAILGGLVIEIGDNTIDLSVSSKLNKLNTLLTTAV